MKALIPENPYLPVGGINPDSNGLTLEPTEAVDAVNLRITPKELKTRDGTRRLASNVPSVDPILHTHTYKAPNGQETLFAFTKRNIWGYVETTQKWDYATTNLLMDACEVVTDWSIVANLTWIGVATTMPYTGTKSIVTSFPLASVTSSIKRINLALDLSAYNSVAFMIAITVSAFGTNTIAVPFTVKFYSDNAMTAQIGGNYTQTISATFTGGMNNVYSSFVCNFATPANWSTVNAILISWEPPNVGSTQPDYVFIDHIYALKQPTTDLTFWHTTDFNDDTIGATVLAAGSIPPKSNATESDGGSRVMYHYNPSTSVFDSQTLNERVTTVDYDTSQTGPALAAIVTGSTFSAAQKSAGDTIVAGTWTIYTAERGILATSSAIANSAGASQYSLIPSDPTHIEEGASSYVDTDGDFSIKFLGDTFSGLKLYALFKRLTISGYKPRFVWNFHNHLLCASTYESASALYYPWRVRWGIAGKRNLVLDTDYQDLINNDLSPIVGGDYQGFYLNIYKEESIVKGSYVGESLIFLFDTVWKDGTYAGKTIQTFQHRQYFLGRTDVYCWDGSALRSITQTGVPLTTMTEKNAGQHRVRDTIFSQLNIDELQNCFGCLYPKYNEYWLWIVKAKETWPSSCYVYNIQRDIWYYFEFEATSCTGNFHRNPTNSWNAMIGKWNKQASTWDAGSLTGTSDALVLCFQAGDTYLIDETENCDKAFINATGTYVDGTDISTRLITKDFAWSDIAREDRCIRVDIEASGTSLTAKSSGSFETLEAGFTQAQTLTLTTPFTKTHYNPDILSYHIRFCLTSTSPLAIRWIIPYAIVKKLLNQ